MGGVLGKLLSSPLSGLIKSVGGIIDNLNTSSGEKLAAQKQLVELEYDFQKQMASLDVEFAKAQAGVVQEEVKSHSWMARNWRPILMLTFTYIIAHNFIIAPMFNTERVPIPPDMWDLLRIGMGGYIAGRSLEKIAAPVAQAIVSANKK